jgi:hypothetical protein
MQVAVEDFVPSLAGYVQSLDVTTSLRLCNRYGRGSRAFVNKLPTELVELIEAHVHIAMRQRAFAEWEQQKRCTEGRCACDHDEHWIVERRELHNSPPAKRTALSIAVGNDLNPHHANIHDFSRRTRGFRALDADARLIKRYFGLDIWTPITHSYDVHPGDVRLRPHVPRPGLREQLLPDLHRTQSQLLFVLPRSSQHERGGDDWFPESFSMYQDFMAAPCPERRLMRRFLRVFRMLGLQPDEDLGMLETVVNLAATEGTGESNSELRQRIFDRLAELGEGPTQHVVERKVWPEILHVQRNSSWESRMQTGWLAKDAS